MGVPSSVPSRLRRRSTTFVFFNLCLVFAVGLLVGLWVGGRLFSTSEAGGEVEDENSREKVRVSMSPRQHGLLLPHTQACEGRQKAQVSDMSVTFVSLSRAKQSYNKDKHGKKPHRGRSGPAPQHPPPLPPPPIHQGGPRVERDACRAYRGRGGERSGGRTQASRCLVDRGLPEGE